MIEERTLTVSQIPRLPRSVVSVDRHLVLFPQSGQSLRLGLGIHDGWELRWDFGWMTQAQSGHSGQLDLLLGIKRRLAEISSLHVSTYLGAGGVKNMGWKPAYFGLAKLPASVEWKAVEISLAPFLRQQLTLARALHAGLEMAGALSLGPEWALFLESHYHPQDLSSGFVNFEQAKGLATWAGLRWTPLPQISIPLLFVAKPPREGAHYGLLAASFQLRLAY